MDKLIIPETPRTPMVNFDPDAGIFEIRGRSIPENPEKFYTPLVEWLDRYTVKQDCPVTVKVLLYYYNTASSKRVVELFRKLDEVHKKGTIMKIIWEYERGDDDARWDGETMAKIISVPFEFVEIEEY
ncbi:MAG: DUF1987 domain-containing protein [Bacteroidetes bacterium]|nr:DUF1987 domain-containing protein [Bacteroidota bacterium]